jgi:hypothetical protein
MVGNDVVDQVDYLGMIGGLGIGGPKWPSAPYQKPRPGANQGPLDFLFPYMFPSLMSPPTNFPDAVWDAAYASDEFKEYLESLKTLAKSNVKPCETIKVQGPGLDVHIHLQNSRINIPDLFVASTVAGGIDLKISTHEVTIVGGKPGETNNANSSLPVHLHDNYGFGNFSGDPNGNWGNTMLKWLTALPSLGMAKNYDVNDDREYKWIFSFIK